MKSLQVADTFLRLMATTSTIRVEKADFERFTRNCGVVHYKAAFRAMLRNFLAQAPKEQERQLIQAAKEMPKRGRKAAA